MGTTSSTEATTTSTATTTTAHSGDGASVNDTSSPVTLQPAGSKPRTSVNAGTSSEATTTAATTTRDGASVTSSYDIITLQPGSKPRTSVDAGTSSEATTTCTTATTTAHQSRDGASVNVTSSHVTPRVYSQTSTGKLKPGTSVDAGTSSTEATTTSTAATTTAHSRNGASVSSHVTPCVYPQTSTSLLQPGLKPGTSVNAGRIRSAKSPTRRQASTPESGVESDMRASGVITRGKKESNGGDDWHSQLRFVRPQESIQTMCPICLDILSEPYMVSCCGYSFCRVCIERILTAKGSCPWCSAPEFEAHQNKGLKRTLNGLHVSCPYESSGCRWVGEMRNVRKHLKEKDEFAPGACKFAQIKCSQCHKKIQRQKLETHRNEWCTQRPFRCEHCREYNSVYDDVVSNHWPTCKCYPMPCPNDCGVSPERQQLEHHVDKECPLTVISCEFCYAGCDVQLSRKDMPEHMNENSVMHVSLIAGTTRMLAEDSQQQKCVTQQLNDKLEQGQKILDGIRKENEELKSELQCTKEENQEAAIPHKEITDLREEVLTKFETEKEALIEILQQAQLSREELLDGIRKENEELKTEFQHTKLENQTLKTRMVELTEDQKAAVTHQEIANLREEVFTKLETESEAFIEALQQAQLRREQDIDDLRREHKQAVSKEAEEIRQVVNELRKKQKDIDILKYELKHKQEESMIETEALQTQVGEFKQNQDEVKALKEEIAQLRQLTSQLRMKQEQSRFSVEFTMPDFSKHKRTNDCWSSNPFFAYPHRYKLCLDVYANGFGSCKGKHVSIYARLLRGEFDDHLEWPFQGDIVIQLLNQLEEDKHPHEVVISFSEEVPSKVEYASRVTTAEESKIGWGYDDFILQDELHYNQTEMCQYLMDDCLSFRVMQARPLDLMQENATLRRYLEEVQKEKEATCELQPYSSLLVDCVDSKGKTITWQDIGIMVNVPPDATPEHNPVVHVQAQCFLPGPGLSVVLPENVQLASPIYRISATSQFSENVELSIAHFATLDSNDDMTFLHSSDRSPPYRFQLVPGGKFIPHGTCGSLWLSKFCKIAAGKKGKKTASKRRRSTPQPARESPYRYAVVLCSPDDQFQHDCRRAIFSTSLYHPAFMENLMRELKASFPNVKFWPSAQFVELLGDGVELLIPLPTARQQGYSITSDRNCQISKGEIHLPDQFQPTSDSSFTMYPPRLRLTVGSYGSEHPTNDLECSLDVKGTVKPCCFTLKMKAPPASEGVLSSLVRGLTGFRRSSSTYSTASSSSASFEEPRDSITKPSLQELSSSVAPKVSHVWYQLGIQLGLDPCFLKAIEKDHRSSQDGCVEMFRQWLMRPELNPSWETLIQALRSSIIAQRDLAQELSRQYS